MPVLEKHTMLVSPTPDVVATEGLGGRLLASSDDSGAGWERIIDDFIVPWGQNPSLLDDEENTAPSARIMELVSQVTIKLRRAGAPAPLRVVPDGEGGISFEWQEGKLFRSLDISCEGEIELCVFVDCREVGRYS